jgi:hypothetical protein
VRKSFQTVSPRTRVNKGKRKEGRLAIMVISYIYMGYYNTSS